MQRDPREIIIRPIISEHSYDVLENNVYTFEVAKDANKIENERDKAIAYSLHVAPCLETIRYHVDKLELLVDNEMWPLPKYRELLFIR